MTLPSAIALDTNVVSEVLRQSPDPGVMQYLHRVSDRSVITSVTLADLFYGAQRLPEGRRRSGLLSNIKDLRVAYKDRTVAFDAAAAEHYGASVAQLQAAGRAISVADAYIAAVCATRKLVLATRNIKDFADYPGLEVINPWSR